MPEYILMEIIKDSVLAHSPAHSLVACHRTLVYTLIPMIIFLGTSRNTISAIVWSPITHTEIFHQSIPASWGSYHDFSIDWKPFEIKFIVDGTASATFAYSLGNLSLPVGIFNARSPTMLTDWVKVCK